MDAEAIRIKDRRGRRRATIKRTDAELFRSRARRGRRRATIKKADAEAIQIKSPQKQEKRDNLKDGFRNYTD